MITWIRIGGKERPVCFGYQVAYDYEFNTGRNYNELLVKVSDMMFQSAAAVVGTDGAVDMEIDEVAILLNEQRRNAVASFSIVPFTDLVYHGMLYACRREGVEVDFEAADVAEWVFGDQQALSACMRLLMDSLPQYRRGETPDEAKKKTIAARGATHLPNASTGKSYSKPRR